MQSIICINLSPDRGPEAAPALPAPDSDPVVAAWIESGGVGRPRSTRAISTHAVGNGVGKTYGWCILVLTFTTSYEVFSRYLFLAPTEWAFDASYMLYGTLFMMAGAYALSRNGHVRGDFIYRAWSPRRQAGMDLVLYFLFFFPGMLAFVYAGYGFAELSRMMNEHSSASPERPDRLAVQVADRDRRRADGDPGHRRGDPLHHLHSRRRMAASACTTSRSSTRSSSKRPRRRIRRSDASSKRSASRKGDI